MSRVMAVSFERYGQLHYLDPGERDYSVGDWVLYPTADGPEVAQCVWAPEQTEATFEDLPRCLGPATQTDHDRDRRNRAIRADAARTARDLIAQHGLPMKVVGIDFLDRCDKYDRLVAIYYTAPNRVDFRQLLGDLARALKSRIDLRQVDARDAARLIGGVGSCGREFCCTTFLTDFQPVSMRLVKLQGLPPNPLQIAGACGRLMCCLKYEHPLYEDFHRRAPSLGEQVDLDEGVGGRVIGHCVPADEVRIRTNAGEIVRCPLESVCSRRTARLSLGDV